MNAGQHLPKPGVTVYEEIAPLGEDPHEALVFLDEDFRQWHAEPFQQIVGLRIHSPRRKQHERERAAKKAADDQIDDNIRAMGRMIAGKKGEALAHGSLSVKLAGVIEHLPLSPSIGLRTPTQSLPFTQQPPRLPPRPASASTVPQSPSIGSPTAYQQASYKNQFPRPQRSSATIPVQAAVSRVPQFLGPVITPADSSARADPRQTLRTLAPLPSPVLRSHLYDGKGELLPIPKEIVELADGINELPKSSKRLPVRKHLFNGVYAEHFGVIGLRILRHDSPLYAWRFDERLFNRRYWDFFIYGNAEYSDFLLGTT